jgi:hypothetical protein
VTFSPSGRFRNQRPKSPVGLNINHPLNKGIQYSNFFLQNTDDLVKKNIHISKTSAMTFKPQGLQCGGDGVSGGGEKITLNDAFDFSDTNACTIFVGYRFAASDATSNTFGGLISDKNAGNWGSAVGLAATIRYTGGLFFRIGTTAAYTDTDYLNNGKLNNIAYRWDGGNLEIFANAEEVNYVAQGSVSSFSKSGIAARIGTYYDETYQWTTDGIIAYIHIINWAAPDALIQSMALNPWQVLEKEKIYFTIGQAAGVSTLFPQGLLGLDLGFNPQRSQRLGGELQ